LNLRIVRQIAVAHHCANSKPTSRDLFDLVERQQIDIHQSGWALYVELHQINQRGAPSDKFGMGTRTGDHRPLHVVNFLVLKGLHDSPSWGTTAG
jgi:hypothetical protein